MPKFRLYMPHIFEKIYEINADSREDALKIADNKGLDHKDYMGDTDPRELILDFNIKVEEI